MNTAIILASGVGSRVGANIPKQFIEVGGRPILSYTIEAFERHPEVDGIAIVCHQDFVDELKHLINSERFEKVQWITEGGADFQHSVMNGLDVLSNALKPDDIVLIHYGASPFVDGEIISDALRVCADKGNSSPAMPMIYLSAHDDLPDSTDKPLDRSNVIRLNAPQALRFGYACWLYNEAQTKGLLDKVDPHTTSLMLALGERIYYSKDKTSNIKITTQEDVELFRRWIGL